MWYAERVLAWSNSGVGFRKLLVWRRFCTCSNINKSLPLVKSINFLENYLTSICKKLTDWRVISIETLGLSPLLSPWLCAPRQVKNRVHRAFEASFVMGLSDRIDMKTSWHPMDQNCCDTVVVQALLLRAWYPKIFEQPHIAWERLPLQCLVTSPQRLQPPIPSNFVWYGTFCRST